MSNRVRQTEAKRGSKGATRKASVADDKSQPWSWRSAILAAAAVLLGGFLLYRTLNQYSVSELIASIMEIPLPRIAAAAAFAAASYLCLTGFDWLALRYVGHPLRYRYVALASFTSLSLGHNIGFAALSSGAIRYRFYSRKGLGLEEVAKVIVFCGTTVGLGLAALGGVALLLRADLAVDVSGLSRSTIFAVGFCCLGACAGYLILAKLVRKPLQIWKWSVEMPTWRLAAAQLIIGPLNFAFVAACLHQTLSAVADVSYFAVAATYVIATTTTLITHVPGGLGVIESVVLFLLPQDQLIGALLMFRIVYFLVPLCLGSIAFVLAELAFARNKPSTGRTTA